MKSKVLVKNNTSHWRNTVNETPSTIIQIDLTAAQQQYIKTVAWDIDIDEKAVNIF